MNKKIIVCKNMPFGKVGEVIDLTKEGTWYDIKSRLIYDYYQIEDMVKDGWVKFVEEENELLLLKFANGIKTMSPSYETAMQIVFHSPACKVMVDIAREHCLLIIDRLQETDGGAPSIFAIKEALFKGMK